MNNRYYIIDDFYENPDQIRSLLIESQKEETSGGNYPGVMTELAIYSEDTQKFFQGITGEPVFPGTSLNGKFRFTKRHDTATQHIHFDFGENLAWAGVVFLSKDAEDYGTSFYRHKRTNLEEIPKTLEGIQKYGWFGVDDLKKFLDTEGMDHTLWDKTLTVPGKYNRLILFRPWMFHASDGAFGDTFENCRLIQTFFLKI